MNHNTNSVTGDSSLANDESGSNENNDDHHNCDSSNGGPRTELIASNSARPRLGSRVLVTWLELTVIGITGGLLGATIGGPPGFIIYLTTTLLTVGIILYNVNELIKGWIQTLIEST